VKAVKIGIAPEVFDAWPSYRRIVVVARDVDNAEEDPALEALLREAEAAARQDPELENHKEYPRIASWRAVFEWMGLNPLREGPSPRQPAGGDFQHRQPQVPDSLRGGRPGRRDR
jgi:DNA/RNA-binding domain of Phe-tRNA-synthetase-like protein